MERIPGVVKKVLPAIVSITVSKMLPVFEGQLGPSPLSLEDFSMVPKGKKKMQIGGGSGFIVDSSGTILTNRHVVADPTSQYVALLNDGKTYEANVLVKDPINDVAILKINAKNIPYVELGDSAKLMLGQTVLAIGNTLGIFPNTISVGVVSGLSRQISAFSAFDQKSQQLKGLIQTDAAINPGNSGGPLVNMQGKVVGINAAMVFMAENIGFALPINAAKKDLGDLKKYGRLMQPFLGVRYILLNKLIQRRYHLSSDHGALVITEKIPEGYAVVPGSPAEQAGIKEGDIIFEVGREKISQQTSVEDILQKFHVGDEIEIKILRQNQEITKKIILVEKK